MRFRMSCRHRTEVFAVAFPGQVLYTHCSGTTVEVLKDVVDPLEEARNLVDAQRADPVTMNYTFVETGLSIIRMQERVVRMMELMSEAVKGVKR